MKTSLVILMAAALSTQAALIKFELSPAGTDAALGLSPLNEVPAATNSTGSGGLVSGGITLDTDTLIMDVAIGYGSAAGFTDLTGPATAAHFHGPAGPGTNAGVVVSLVPIHFPAANAALGGVIVGKLAISTNALTDLLAGLNYVNIHTANYPGGELRAQLIPLVATNAPPSVSCPADATVSCDMPAEVVVLVSDPDGDELNVVWTLNGAGLQTNTIAAGSPAGNVTFTGKLPVGTNVLGVAVTDSATNTASCSTTITVVDTNAPVITAAAATPNVLWPPNHKMVEVKVRATVTDACSATVWKVIGVRSSEPDNGLGDGDTARDWEITGDHAVKLRAERSGTGSGRVYTLTLQAQDAAGNLSATRTVTVKVPKSQAKH